jgi:hypothetical protein
VQRSRRDTDDARAHSGEPRRDCCPGSTERSEQPNGALRTNLTSVRCPAASRPLEMIARVYGFMSWPRLVHHIEELRGDTSHLSAFERAADAIASADMAALDQLISAQSDLVHTRSTRKRRTTLLNYVSANAVENYRQRTRGYHCHHPQTPGYRRRRTRGGQYVWRRFDDVGLGRHQCSRASSRSTERARRSPDQTRCVGGRRGLDGGDVCAPEYLQQT